MEEKEQSWMSALLSFASRCKGKMILSVILSIISILAGFVPFYGVYQILRLFIDRQANLNGILLWCAISAAGYIIKLICFGFSTVLSHVSAYTILETIRNEITDNLMKAPLGEVMNKTIGQIKGVIVDRVENIEPPLAHFIPEASGNLLLPLLIFIYLIIFDWRMALVSMVTIPLAMIPLSIMFKGYGEKYDNYIKARDHVNSVIVEYIEGIEVVKAFNQASSSYEKFSKSVLAFKDFTVAWFESTWVLMYSAFSIMPSTLIGTLPVGLILYSNGSLSAVQLCMCLILSLSMVAPLMRLEVFGNEIKEMEYGIKETLELLNIPTLPDASERVSITSHHIKLKNVSFSYTGKKQESVLHHIDLKMPEGSFTALVGPSGSGKSTVAKLIARFNCSLKENIRLGNPGAKDDEVYAAARAACCDEFISKLEAGYDTPAGDAGKRLSGGEKQRIAIARAILKKAPIVILDEATAFTDPENEDKIQQSLMALTKGKTLLVIAHRLSTIQSADQIVVLRQGSIEAVGRHNDLIRDCQLYSNMWQAHIGAKSWSVSGQRGGRLIMFKTLIRIMHWCSPYKKRLFLGFVCAFFTTWCAAAPTMIAANALGKVIDDTWGLSNFDHTIIWQSFLAIIVLVFLRFLFSYLRARQQESIGYELAAEQRVNIGDMLKRVSLGYFQEHNAGDILSTVTTELSSLEYQGMRMINEIVNGYINVIVIILCLGIFSISAALIAVAGIVLSLIFLHGVSRQSEKNAPLNEKAIEDMSGATIEYVRGMPVVKSFGQEGISIENMKKACKDSKDIHIKIEKGFTPFNCLHLASLKFASIGLVLITTIMTLGGQMELPIMLMFCMFSFTIFGSVESVNDSAHVLGVIDSAMNKLNEIEHAEYIDENGENINIDQYDISFDHVSFGYDSREVLHDISFHIPENTTTAIVGPSGSGKTTICSLLARFYDAMIGSIRISGIDIKDFTCDSLLKNISMVFQNVYLFHDTVRNNIRFGNPKATETEIEQAAIKARCHDFIMALPDGYDTMIGEGGSSLSGGEKQRISIARAILKNAPIVILDEATASVDPENEHLIQGALSSLTHGKTIITIAHRLATIQNADQILVIDNGRLVQQGTHSRLLEEEGVYRRFIGIREKAEGWKIS